MRMRTRYCLLGASLYLHALTLIVMAVLTGVWKAPWMYGFLVVATIALVRRWARLFVRR